MVARVGIITADNMYRFQQHTVPPLFDPKHRHSPSGLPAQVIHVDNATAANLRPIHNAADVI